MGLRFLRPRPDPTPADADSFGALAATAGKSPADYAASLRSTAGVAPHAEWTTPTSWTGLTLTTDSVALSGVNVTPVSKGGAHDPTVQWDAAGSRILNPNGETYIARLRLSIEAVQAGDATILAGAGLGSVLTLALGATLTGSKLLSLFRMTVPPVVQVVVEGMIGGTWRMLLADTKLVPWTVAGTPIMVVFPVPSWALAGLDAGTSPRVRVRRQDASSGTVKVTAAGVGIAQLATVA